MTSTTIVSRKLLKKFMTRKKLSGIASFLRFLEKRNNLEDFYVFCEQHDCKLQTPKHLSPGVLFHGSQKLHPSLMPNANVSISRHGKAERGAFVYATDDPNYAIFLALLNLRNGGASVMVSGKEPMLVVDLDFVNGPSKIKNGYVHVVPSQSFKKTKNREYVANGQVTILLTVPVTLQDLTVPIYIQTES